tara:strand:+ start:2674 stop:3036 length:363 start_codon:yes stop_codon:yes gene_type:complete
MTSTRNKNSKNDYLIEQKSYKDGTQYNLYEYSQHGKPETTMLPDFGLNSARMSRFELSSNSVNIESQLFGIGSTNLVEPKSVIPESNIHIPHASIHTFDDFTIMPEPLVIEKDQRPNKLN